MKTLAPETKAHEQVQLFCDADERSIIENELQVNFSDHTEITVEYAYDLMRYL